MANKLNQDEGVFLVSTSMQNIVELKEKEKKVPKFSDYGSLIVLAQEAKIENIVKLIDITPEEAEKLATFTIASRLFLYKNKEHSMALELSIGGLPELTRLFSASKLEIAAYKEIIKQHNQDDVSAWLPPLLEKLSEV